ncbi:MAG TPA: hypothetical protein VF834_21265 [Streptosporangiaceae bacterium]
MRRTQVAGLTESAGAIRRRPVTDISRRSALHIGGVALAGMAIRQASAAHPRIVFGVNRNYYEEFTTAVPGARAVRIYYSVENVFPAQWPNRLPGAWVTLSIRPHPGDLLRGRLDSQIRELVDSAPPCSELSIWHEAGPGNPLRYPAYINADSMYHMHAHMQHLCRGTNVRYGSIISGPANQCQAWLGRNLDWYGTDQYDNPRFHNADGTLSQAKLYQRMDANLATWRKVAGTPHPAIRICETNSPSDSHRAHWFSLLAAWMAHNNGHRILTYWNPEHGSAAGGLSGAWPPSRRVVSQLAALARTYR